MIGYVAGRRTVDKHAAVVAEARDVFFGVLDRLRHCGRFLIAHRCAFSATCPVNPGFLAATPSSRE